VGTYCWALRSWCPGLSEELGHYWSVRTIPILGFPIIIASQILCKGDNQLSNVIKSQIKIVNHIKTHQIARHWRVMPIILATQEADIKKISVQSQPLANSL
jgi:hypothetical protein